MEIRTRKFQLQQSPGILCYGNFSNSNQFEGGSQATFNSDNFGSPIQFPSGFGGNSEYGGVCHYGENGGSGASGGHGSNARSDRSDDSLPEY